MNKKKLQTDFLNKLGGYGFIHAIFNSFPDTHIFVKDLKGRHIFQNDLFALKRGFTRSEDAIGYTAYHFTSKAIADKYAMDDNTVFQTGQPIINREEKIYSANGKAKWFSTTKVPLFDVKGKVIGLTGISRDISELRALVDKVKKQKKELENLTIRDSLTNAHNRRFLEKNLEEVYKAYKRMKKGSSLITFDLDKFKSINDTYGHSTGDLVLKKFTDCVNHSLRRKTDFLIRHGGDEFVLCLLGAEADFATNLAETILKNLKEIQWPKKTFKGKPFALSVSIGIASDTASSNQNNSLENLLKKSDQAVYEAKAKGGNCVVCK